MLHSNNNHDDHQAGNEEIKAGQLAGKLTYIFKSSAPHFSFTTTLSHITEKHFGAKPYYSHKTRTSTL